MKHLKIMGVVFLAMILTIPSFSETMGSIYGMSLDSEGNIWTVDASLNLLTQLSNGKVEKVIGKSLDLDLYGEPIGIRRDSTLEDAVFNGPRDMCFYKDRIYIADTENHVIRMVYGGRVYTYAGSGQPGYKNGGVRQAEFNNPSGVAVDTNGNVYVADTLNHVIRKIDTEGMVTTYAGKTMPLGGYRDGPLLESSFNEPSSLLWDKEGRLYVADSGNHMIRRIIGDKVETYAGVYTDERISGTAYLKGGHQDGYRLSARFNFPKGMTIDNEGNLLVADSRNQAIRVIKNDGEVYTLRLSVSQYPTDVQLLNQKLYYTDNGLKMMPWDRENPYYFLGEGITSITFVYEGRSLNPKYYMKDQLYVPLREMVTFLGGSVQYDSKTKKTTVVRGENRIVITPSNSNLWGDGKTYVSYEVLKTGFHLKGVYQSKLKIIYIE